MTGRIKTLPNDMGKLLADCPADERAELIAAGRVYRSDNVGCGLMYQITAYENGYAEFADGSAGRVAFGLLRVV